MRRCGIWTCAYASTPAAVSYSRQPPVRLLRGKRQNPCSSCRLRSRCCAAFRPELACSVAAVGKEDFFTQRRKEEKTPRSDRALHFNLYRHGRVGRQRVPATQKLHGASSSNALTWHFEVQACVADAEQALGGRYALPPDAAMTNVLGRNVL
jgi:hypothetical protein